MKVLWVLRHAKAQAGSPSGGDHDRALTSRGERQVTEVGVGGMAAGVAAGVALPGLVLSSSATRALETARGVLPWTGDADLVAERDLYLADPDDLVERLRLIDDEYPSVMLVGHNPTVSDLVHLLGSGPGGRPEAGELPTGGLAVLELDIASWARLGSGTGRVVCSFAPG